MSDALDFYRLDETLGADEQQVRDVVRRFVKDRILPRAGALWQAGEFPREVIPEMAALGLYGPSLPEKYGGAGLSGAAYGVMMRELEYGDSGLRSFASVQSGLSMYAIYRWGSEEQRTAFLPKMAAGEIIGCFGLTEPDAGSDPASMQTRARRTDNGYILSGAKRWITNGSLAKLAIVWAKDEDDVIRGFIVPTDAPGFTARDIKTKASMRMSVTSELFLDGVEVTEDHRLPEARGLSGPLSCLTQARYGIAWGTVGAAMACLEEALGYTGSRIAFGRPIAATQMVQERLVDMVSEVARMQLAAFRLGQLYQAGELRHQQVSLAKRDNARGALTVARMARELLGGNGITTDYGPMRHAANLETVDTYEGTYEVHTLIVGRDITGQDAF
ncbi:MAG: acyl-CoA dehydrogenase family protein [Clostridia bacterium]